MKTGRRAAASAVLIACLIAVAHGDAVPGTEIDRVRSALRDPRPGDTIVLPDGTWQDVELTISAAGEPGRPITLRAVTPGKAVFTGASSVTLAGKHLVLDGFLFTGKTPARTAPVRFAHGSEDCRLTNSAIIDFNPPDFDTRSHYVRVGGVRNRVDHCLFAGKTNMGPMLAADGGTHARIDHNHFRDFPHHPRNGREVIQVMGVGSNDEPLEAGGTHWVIERNLFSRAHGEGAEIISLKSNHNVVRHNTVRATRGALTMRSGGGNAFESNVILGDGERGTGGLRVSGRDARTVNNYVAGVTSTAIRLHAGEYIDRDVSGGYVPLNRQGAPLGRVAHYLQLADGVVANNLVVDTHGAELLDFGSGYGNAWPAQQMILLPDNLRFENNLFVATRGGSATTRPTLTLRTGDNRLAKLPPDARPRPVRGANNVLSGVHAPPHPPEFGFQTFDYKLAESPTGLLLPAVDAPPPAGGFDPAPFRDLRPLTPADVGPSWAR